VGSKLADFWLAHYLTPACQSLLDRYDLGDTAIEVVGISRVGTRCCVLLFMAGQADPLFLQVKEVRVGFGALRRSGPFS